MNECFCGVCRPCRLALKLDKIPVNLPEKRSELVEKILSEPRYISPAVIVEVTHKAVQNTGYTDQAARRTRDRRTHRRSLRVMRNGHWFAPTPGLVHGSTHVYWEWGCRCEKCRVVGTEATAAKRRRKAEREAGLQNSA